MAVRTTRCTVYGLMRSDERTIRYIGQTTRSLSQRLSHHLCTAKDSSNQFHKANWIRKALAEGVEIKIVALVENAKLNETEKQVISQYKKTGIDLVNSNDGGKGAAGWSLSPEFKKNRKEVMQGNTIRLGKTVGPEGRKNISEGHKRLFKVREHWATGKELPAETKEKISKSLMGRKLKTETIEKMKQPKTEAHRQRIKEAALKRWARVRGETYGC